MWHDSLITASLQQISLRYDPFTHRLWVPSPLWGKVRMRGCMGRSAAVGPLTLALSHEGRGDLSAHSRQGYMQVRPANAVRAEDLPGRLTSRSDRGDI